MKVTLAFGPARYALTLDDGALPPELDRWRCPAASEDVAVRVIRAEPADVVPDSAGFAGDGFSVATGDGGVVVAVAPGRPRALISALAALVAQRAPLLGCVVLHAAAVRVAGGVALLLAPSGTGKTTFASLAAGRSFAHNAVIVAPDPTPRAWALPFAGDARPELDAAGEAPVVALARLERGSRPGFEWRSRSGATTVLMQHCARAPARDALARDRFMIASALALRVPFGRLLATRGPHDLDDLDAALATEIPS